MDSANEEGFLSKKSAQRLTGDIQEGLDLPKKGKFCSNQAEHTSAVSLSQIIPEHTENLHVCSLISHSRTTCTQGPLLPVSNLSVSILTRLEVKFYIGFKENS